MRPDPDLLILDEPSAGLDAEAEHDLHERLLARARGHDERADLAPAERRRDGRTRSSCCRAGGSSSPAPTPSCSPRGGEYARLFRLQASGYLTA